MNGEKGELVVVGERCHVVVGLPEVPANGSDTVQ